ncbi:MAG: ATPase, T2SS/T4P/T4SS family [Planctomycetota bacterium]
MKQLLNFRFAIALVASLVLAAVCGNLAVAQIGGLAEQAAISGAQQELAGNRNGGGRRVGGEAPAEESADVEEPADEPEEEEVDPAAAFEQKARNTPLQIAPLLKLFGIVLILLMWVRACDWVNQDSQIYRLGWYKWNHIIFAPFAITTIALFYVPLASIIKIPILFVIFLATWVPYVLVHNKNVQPHQTVLTGSWWRHVLATAAGMVGIKMSSDRVADYEKGVQMDLSAMGAEDSTVNSANLLSARNSPGYLLVKEALADMINRRCERMMLDFTKQAVNVRHEIDGMWHNGEAREREASDVMLAVMKTLSNLDVQDRRSKQAGKFGAKFEGKNYLCSMVSQGVSTGERVIVTRSGTKQTFENYDDLGMREGLQEKWSELMATNQGLLILSTMPGGGLTTITDVSLEETDRLMRDFAAIEDVNHSEREIQNINVTTYDSEAGETPATILPKLVRNYPDVYVCRDMVNVEAAEILFNEVKDEDVVITTVRAREACEALLRILQMKVPAKDFAVVVKAVLYQRLIRLLCPDCKVGYTPPPETLRKLGIPAGKIEQLYRPPKGEEIEKPCKSCQGLGYQGRTGLFELLIVTDPMREILIKQPKLELLKKAARASRQRSLQEEGVLLVAKGETSLQELMRVLKN